MKKNILLTLLSLGICTLSYGQGKLDKAEKSLDKKESTRSTRSSSGSRSNNSSNYSGGGDSFLAELFAPLLLDIILYTTYYAAIETPGERQHSASTAAITKYPYLDSLKGNYSYNWGENTSLFRTTLSNRYIVQNQKLYGNHFNVDMRFLGRIGLEADYLQLWEENTNFGNNTLGIFTAMAKYHRVRTERFNAWWGLGATYVGGEVDEFGFAYGLGAELFFAKPFSLASNFYGGIINQRSVNKFTALLNYHHKRYKFSGGYEHLKIGSLDLSTFSAGVGISF